MIVSGKDHEELSHTFKNKSIKSPIRLPHSATDKAVVKALVYQDQVLACFNPEGNAVSVGAAVSESLLYESVRLILTPTQRQHQHDLYQPSMRSWIPRSKSMQVARKCHD